ncbi:135aa long hypothetical protein [Pyrococcus horikoshii OT3]|uniref:Uncharacterized protein n=1 Tax=Pyrococcus horikoshii (strain ATCC 700860 / DSM 12428 / JCM 9974 / NBRC 100139 / OT-3) TaxID=70601 RepID=O58838_PYRHO|nr:135aa long hypothetical protein [Pyrococcus horikoshii OT3]
MKPLSVIAIPTLHFFFLLIMYAKALLRASLALLPIRVWKKYLVTFPSLTISTRTVSSSGIIEYFACSLKYEIIALAVTLSIPYFFISKDSALLLVKSFLTSPLNLWMSMAKSKLKGNISENHEGIVGLAPSLGIT